MVKQKRRWWNRLEVPLASLAIAATVFGALRKSGHLNQWQQQNNTPWSLANARGAAAGPPAQKRRRLTPGPTGLQVAANALVPVVQAATAVPAAAAHAVVTSTLGRTTADVAASEGRRVAAAIMASVLGPASGAASSPVVSVPAVIVPTTTGGIIAVPKVQRPVRMEGITRPSRRAAAFAPQLQPVREAAVAMEGITRPKPRAAAFAPQLQAIQRAAIAHQAAVAMQGVVRPSRQVLSLPPQPAARVPPVRMADLSAASRSVRQRRGAMQNVSDRHNRPVRDAPYDAARSVRQRRGTMQNVGDRYNQPGRLAGQDSGRTVIPRLPGMNDVRSR